MRDLAKGLVGLSALGFVCALVAVFMGPLMNILPGTFGRASLGLAALAIALVLVFETPGPGK